MIIGLDRKSNFNSFIITIKEPYKINIGSGSCRILLPDGTEKNISLSGDNGGQLEIDRISMIFDTNSEEILGTEVKSETRLNELINRFKKTFIKAIEMEMSALKKGLAHSKYRFYIVIKAKNRQKIKIYMSLKLLL